MTFLEKLTKWTHGRKWEANETGDAAQTSVGKKHVFQVFETEPGKRFAWTVVAGGRRVKFGVATSLPELAGTVRDLEKKYSPHRPADFFF